MGVQTVIPARRPTNVSLDARLVAEARQLGINLSQACDAGLAVAIAQVRSAAWIAANREALASSNAFVEAQGLPLGGLRQF